MKDHRKAPVRTRTPAAPRGSAVRADGAGPGIESLIEAGQRAERSGEWDTALAHYEAALIVAQAEGSGEAARLLRWMGRVHFERGYYEEARAQFTASMERAKSDGRREDVAAALNALALVAQFSGRPDTAESLYEKASALAEELGDQQLGAMIDQNLGILANIRGDLTSAIYRYQTALARFRAMGDHISSARILHNMGMLHVDVGELGPAELCFSAAEELSGRLGHVDMVAKVQVNRAELALKRKELERAREHCDAAYKAFSRLGSESGLAEAYRFYAQYYRTKGNLPLAETHVELALRLAQVCGNTLLEGETEDEKARVHLEQRRYRDSLQALGRAHRVFARMQARKELLDVERRMDRVEESYFRAVRVWEAEGPVAVDRFAGMEHYERVADLAAGLARAVGFEGRDLTWMRIGSLLYDIGKASLPQNVLEKPGPLSHEEWALVRRHPVIGDEMVSELNPPWDVSPMVRHHHEHWDGSGYPDGLAGEAIPLTARILAVADTYAALTAERSYRAAMDIPAAMRVMEQEAGKVLDPELFRVFRGLELAESRGMPTGRGMARA